MTHHILFLLLISTTTRITVTAELNLTTFDTATQSSITFSRNQGRPRNAINPPLSNQYSLSKCTRLNPNSTADWSMFPLPFGAANITIYYRETLQFRLEGPKLFVGDTLTIPPDSYECVKGPDLGLPNITITIPCYAIKQYVIYYDDENNGGYVPTVEICSVLLSGCQPSIWGSNCKEECSKNCKERYCNPVNGSFVWGCPEGNGSQIENENLFTRIGIPVLSAIISAILVLAVIRIRGKLNSCNISRKGVPEQTLQMEQIHTEAPVYYSIPDQNQTRTNIYDNTGEDVAQGVNGLITCEIGRVDRRSGSLGNFYNNEISSSSSSYASITGSTICDDAGKDDQGFSSLDTYSNHQMSSSGYAAFQGLSINDDIGQVNKSNLYSDMNQTSLKTLCEPKTATNIDQTNLKTVAGAEQSDEKEQTRVKSVCDIE